jgi:hypothetical protein
MPQVEKLKIFLASPGDVNTERRHVEKVVAEINRTVASSLNVIFDIVSSKNAFPGYGKDGQAILNEQIGTMHECELFIGIMWNRIGTPTPRAQSGTVEEFTRAAQSLTQRKKPEVWFYFRQAASHLKTQEELDQRAEVLRFREKFQKIGLFRDYTTPSSFRDQLREHLTIWLNERKGGLAQPRSVERMSPINESRAKSTSGASTNGTKKKLASATSGIRNSAIAKTVNKAPTSKNGSPPKSRGIQTPGNWILLDGRFFQAKSSTTQSDQSIVLQVQPKDLTQTAELKAIYSGGFHHRRQVIYADSHQAGTMLVSSVTTDSHNGKTSFSISLTPERQSSNSGLGIEMGFNKFSAEEIAEMRVRSILLGEALPKDLKRFFTTTLYESHNHSVTLEQGIFTELWARLKTQPDTALVKAWLWTAHCLKMNNLIENILELKLGPVKGNVLPVRFRGQRKAFYLNQEPRIIEVVGQCNLST